MCVWVVMVVVVVGGVSQPFSEPHGNQLSFIHCAGTWVVSQLAILLLWGTGDMGCEWGRGRVAVYCRGEEGKDYPEVAKEEEEDGMS